MIKTFDYYYSSFPLTNHHQTSDDSIVRTVKLSDLFLSDILYLPDRMNCNSIRLSTWTRNHKLNQCWQKIHRDFEKTSSNMNFCIFFTVSMADPDVFCSLLDAILWHMVINFFVIWSLVESFLIVNHTTYSYFYIDNVMAKN